MEKSEQKETKSNQHEEPEKENGKAEETGKETKEVNANDVDISTPCWFYTDVTGSRQGPFSFKEMFLWWKSGFFPNELLVKTVWETNFAQISQIPEFYNASPKLVDRIEKEQEDQMKKGSYEIEVGSAFVEEVPQTGLPGPEVDFQDYSVAGGFNQRTGKFQKTPGNPYWTSKKLPSDRDERMVSNYMDPEEYQKQKNQEAKDKKKKLAKGTKKFWKERKEKKRKAKLLADLMAD